MALVIGDSTYGAMPNLANPSNDARGVADTLLEVGFTNVRVVTDASRDSMDRALRAFRDEVETADWAVINFAGHGMEVLGTNYLVPTDARVNVDRDIAEEAIPLDRLRDTVGSARKLKLVMLDACRNNNLGLGMQQTIAAAGAVSRDFAPVKSEASTLVFYAAKEREIAAAATEPTAPLRRPLSGVCRSPASRSTECSAS